MSAIVQLIDDLGAIDADPRNDYLDRHVKLLGSIAVGLRYQAQCMNNMAAAAKALGLLPVCEKTGTCSEVLNVAVRRLEDERIRLLTGKIAAGNEELAGILDMVFSGGRSAQEQVPTGVDEEAAERT